jgi:putative transposase
MKQLKTYKYKLYNRDATKHLDRIIDLSSKIYNHCIALHRRYYKLYKKQLNKYQLQKHLTKLKKLHKEWNEVPSQAIQDITDRIDRAYKLFYSNLKKKKKTSVPHFQKRQNYCSFTTKQAGYKLLEGNKIKISDKIYSYWKSREIKGEIKTLTVKRTGRGYYIYLVCEEEVSYPNQVTSGNSVGFDFGMKNFLTASDGNNVSMPLFLKKNLNRLARLSQKFSKSKGKRGSKRTLVKLHEKVANQRNDMHWKLAHLLTDLYDVLCFETLELQTMLKSCQKKIMDFGFAKFISILEYVAKQKGKAVVFVDKWFPSSKLCSECGWKNESLTLKDREWLCIECGCIHDRDHNASVNILREGTSSLSACTSGAIRI